MTRRQQFRQWWGNLFNSQSKTASGSIVPATRTNPKTSIQTPNERSYGTITIFWVIGVLVVYVAYLLFNSLSLLYLILTGAFIAVAMEKTILFFQKLFPRGISIGISYILLLIFLAMGVIIIIPFAMKQLAYILDIAIKNLAGVGQEIATMGLSGYISSLTWLANFLKTAILNNLAGDYVSYLQNSIIRNISMIVSEGTNYASMIGTTALNAIGSFFAGISQITIVLTIAVFFSIEKERVIHFILYCTSDQLASTNIVSDKINLFYQKMGIWLQTQLLLCFYIFSVVYITLWIASLFGFALPNILSLSLMAGFTEFIPYLGPILGAIPSLIVAMIFYGWKGALIIIAIFVAIQQIENNVLVPLLMNKSLGISPLLILLCALFFGSTLGFIGVLLSVPFAILLTIMIKNKVE